MAKRHPRDCPPALYGQLRIVPRWERTSSGTYVQRWTVRDQNGYVLDYGHLTHDSAAKVAAELARWQESTEKPERGAGALLRQAQVYQDLQARSLRRGPAKGRISRPKAARKIPGLSESREPKQVKTAPGYYRRRSWQL